MSIPAAQREVAALLRARSGAEPVETHISLVFVGADTVWKLKKAVRLPFLDFTAIEARRHFAMRELELNARAAPGMYRDVVPVLRREHGGLTLGEPGGGEVVDWVLRLAPVPKTDFLDAVAARGGLHDPLLDAVADGVAAFHAGLPPAERQNPAGAMRAIAEGNVKAARDAGLPADRVEAWRAGCTAALDRIADWQRARAEGGFIRRAHGDLHLGNLCLWQGAPVPFDALEFDEAMATIDLAYDLAFLLMDIDHRVGRGQANRVLNRYVARTGDAGLTPGLPVFLSLRAFIRAHVEAKRGCHAEAAAYLDKAVGYLDLQPAIIVAVGGLQGTGKTTLARALAPALGNAPGALVLRSDDIRKRRGGVPPEAPLPAEAYEGEVSAAVFAELAAAAREATRGGHVVIADATFLALDTRAAIEAAARGAGVPFIGLWLDAPLPELEQRISARGPDASDATVAVLRAAAGACPGAGGWETIDACFRARALEQARGAVRSRAGAC